LSKITISHTEYESKPLDLQKNTRDLRDKSYFILVLIIYTTFCKGISAQELHLSISGSTPLETQSIDSLFYQKKHFSHQEVNNTIDSTKALLINQGYFDLQEIKRIQKSDTLHNLLLKLGNRYSHIRLKVPASTTLLSYLNQNNLSTKNDSLLIKTAFAKALLNQLTSTASNNGKPFTSFQITNISPINNHQLQGILTILTDSTRYINNIVVTGYPKVPMTFIERYAGFKKGKVFNRNELIAQQENLNALSFIKTKKDLEVQFTKDSTNIYLYIEKQSTNRFDGFLGFATNETTNQLQLDGYLDLALTNNLNYGESLTLNYKSDGDDQQQLRIKTDLPYLFNSPLGATAELHLFRRDTTFSETTQEATLYYQLNPLARFHLGYKRKTSDNLLDTENSSPDILDYSRNSITGGFSIFKRQDNYLFPNKRSLIVTGESGSRATAIETLDQLSFSATASSIFYLNDTNQIYLRSTSHILFSDNYVTNELFRFGGITSIRGFEENSIFANLTTVLNTEYRIVLNNSAYIHTIIDAGYFENELLNSKSELFSVGLGAGLRTQAGIFKINIANGKSEGLPFKFSNTKVHLQLEARF
jgi:hypothetical protein